MQGLAQGTGERGDIARHLVEMRLNDVDTIEESDVAGSATLLCSGDRYVDSSAQFPSLDQRNRPRCDDGWRSHQFVTSKEARAARRLPGLMRELCGVWAEGVGFEPTVGFNTYSGLANSYTRYKDYILRQWKTNNSAFVAHGSLILSYTSSNNLRSWGSTWGSTYSYVARLCVARAQWHTQLQWLYLCMIEARLCAVQNRHLGPCKAIPRGSFRLFREI